ncbi:MAG TPA: hypothetical protein PK075_01150 [Chitinophagales bacterium]|nr:hypothetical protein [Chitinophagales bacterium]
MLTRVSLLAGNPANAEVSIARKSQSLGNGSPSHHILKLEFAVLAVCLTLASILFSQFQEIKKGFVAIAVQPTLIQVIFVAQITPPQIVDQVNLINQLIPVPIVGAIAVIDQPVPIFLTQFRIDQVVLSRLKSSNTVTRLVSCIIFKSLFVLGHTLSV